MSSIKTVRFRDRDEDSRTRLRFILEKWIAMGSGWNWIRLVSGEELFIASVHHFCSNTTVSGVVLHPCIEFMVYDTL